MKKKTIISIIIIVLLVGAASIGVMASKAQKFDYYMSTLVINNVDLSSVEDGSYIGSVDAGMIKVKVSVEVIDHEIIDIKIIEHRNGQGEQAETIVNEIKKEQTLFVDDVSGASLSSQVIKKAIENALTQSK